MGKKTCRAKRQQKDPIMLTNPGKRDETRKKVLKGKLEEDTALCMQVQEMEESGYAPSAYHYLD